MYVFDDKLDIIEIYDPNFDDSGVSVKRQHNLYAWLDFRAELHKKAITSLSE